MLIVEGYNKTDYISEIVCWETLFYSDNVEDVHRFIQSLSEDYVTRIAERCDLFNKDLTNRHWEIFVG